MFTVSLEVLGIVLWHAAALLTRNSEKSTEVSYFFFVVVVVNNVQEKRDSDHLSSMMKSEHEVLLQVFTVELTVSSESRQFKNPVFFFFFLPRHTAACSPGILE